jgi:hypothetical protein
MILEKLNIFLIIKIYSLSSELAGLFGTNGNILYVVLPKGKTRKWEELL